MYFLFLWYVWAYKNRILQYLSEDSVRIEVVWLVWSRLLLLCFRFPLSKPQLSSKWVQSLGMKNFIPTANTCLCSEHFRPECFRDYNGKQFLREDAVPTLLTHGQDSSKVCCSLFIQTVFLQRFASSLNWVSCLIFIDWMNELNNLQIELRKRGMVPKETNIINKIAPQQDQDRMREAANQRRDKRGGIRVSFKTQVLFITIINDNWKHQILTLMKVEPDNVQSTTCLKKSNNNSDCSHSSKCSERLCNVTEWCTVSCKFVWGAPAECNREIY